MIQLTNCPTCGHPYEADKHLNGCPRCQSEVDYSAVMNTSASEPNDNRTSSFPDIDGYSDVSLLAEGGFGIVYKATNVRRALVALKVLSPKYRSNPRYEEIRKRFLQEPEILARLDHPNIIKVLGQDTKKQREDATPYFAMPLIKGGTLGNEMQRVGSDLKQALELMITVLDALKHAHYQGVIHQDLKPSNIVLDSKGVPYLIDFGVATDRLGELGPCNGGTEGYIAPELRGGNFEPKEVRPSADIFSIGMILCELVTGHRPFQNTVAHAMTTGTAHSEPRMQIELPAVQMRPELQAIIHKCLQVAPSDRYQHAEEVASELRRYLDGYVVEAGGTYHVRQWLGEYLNRPFFGVLLVLGLVFLSFSAYQIKSTVQEQEIRRWQQSNLDEALRIKDHVQRQLEHYQRLTRSEGSTGALSKAWSLTNPVQRQEALESFCRNIIEFYRSPRGLEQLQKAQPFDTCFVHDATGQGVARWPSDTGNKSYTEKNFGWRDYRQQVLELAGRQSHDATVSRAFLSEVDKNWKIGFGQPIYDTNDNFVGLFVLTVMTDTVFGSIPPDPYPRTRIVMGRRDRYKDEKSPIAGAPRAEWVVLFHPNLMPGSAIEGDDLNGFESISGSSSGWVLREGGDTQKISAQFRDPILAVDAKECPGCLDFPKCTTDACERDAKLAIAKSTLAASSEWRDWKVVISMPPTLAIKAADKLFWEITKNVAIGFGVASLGLWMLTPSFSFVTARLRLRRIRT